jgi:hypothetical protein
MLILGQNSHAPYSKQRTSRHEVQIRELKLLKRPCVLVFTMNICLHNLYGITLLQDLYEAFGYLIVM